MTKAGMIQLSEKEAPSFYLADKSYQPPGIRIMMLIHGNSLAKQRPSAEI